jgi:hypothetical protein
MWLYNKIFIFSEKFCNIISENTFKLLYNILLKNVDFNTLQRELAACFAGELLKE